MVQEFDVAVIGGGVVGLAILRRLAMSGLGTVLLERGADILSGASKGNSALLHTGFDAPAGSLELACVQRGAHEYRAIRERLNLPLVATGAYVVAWDEAQEARLPDLLAEARANGVTDTHLIGGAALRAAEPHLAPGARAALHVPGEAVIDPWSAPLAYGRQALAHGATILTRAEVTGADEGPGGWTLTTPRGEVRARAVVNAAGLFGDRIEALIRHSPFTIKPRKGQFVVFDVPGHTLVNAILLPVPSERTKGVVLFPTIFGNLAIGPTAEETDEREAATCDRATLEGLRARAVEMVPALAQAGVKTIYAGLRPATEAKHYRVEAVPGRAWITVGGIRSTGLSAALGLAEHVADLYASHIAPLPGQPPEPVWTPVPNLAEARERPWEQGREIVCHCERVTRDEVRAALDGPLAAGDLGGLKRRTRAMMGRCQGFNCGAEVRAMAAAAGLADARAGEGRDGTA